MIHLSAPTVGLLVGAAILLLGRKLFWLFVAAVGFAYGAELAPQIIHHPTPVVILVIALVLGLLGALFAVILQAFAVGASGFLTGGWLAIRIYEYFVGHVRNVEILYLIGGILGAILFLALFDWVLIIFSSLLGAHLILPAVRLAQTSRTVLFILLIVIGIIVQSSMLSPARRYAHR